MARVGDGHQHHTVRAGCASSVVEYVADGTTEHLCRCRHRGRRHRRRSEPARSTVRRRTAQCLQRSMIKGGGVAPLPPVRACYRVSPPQRAQGYGATRMTRHYVRCPMAGAGSPCTLEEARRFARPLDRRPSGVRRAVRVVPPTARVLPIVPAQPRPSRQGTHDCCCTCDILPAASALLKERNR